MTLASMLVTVGVASAPVRAQEQERGEHYVAPRTAWGDPDLQGAYGNDMEIGTPFEKPAEFAGRDIDDITPEELAQANRARNEQFNDRVGGDEFAGGLRPPTYLIFDSFQRHNSRPWLVVDPPDGKVPPMTAEALARVRQPRRGVSSNANPVGPFDSYEDLGLYDRCISRGIPSSMMPAGYGANYQIVQGPGYVAITYEMVHETRIVPLGDGPADHRHVGDDIRLYVGDARGWWEGDTLVVETTNFTDKLGYRGSSENLRLVERFRAISPRMVEWSVTFDDPHTWDRPWTFAMNLTKLDDSQQVFEYACHEGNLGLHNMLSAARAKD